MTNYLEQHGHRAVLHPEQPTTDSEVAECGRCPPDAGAEVRLRLPLHLVAPGEQREGGGGAGAARECNSADPALRQEQERAAYGTDEHRARRGGDDLLRVVRACRVCMRCVGKRGTLVLLLYLSLAQRAPSFPFAET